MKITITGPRSVGKTTIAKLLAKRLKLTCYSSDEIGEKAMNSYGGLDKAIKSGIIKKFIKKSSYGLIRSVYKKNNFVFDLSGGAVTSREFAEASRKVRNTAKKNSVVIGLLPSKKLKESAQFLYEREKKRVHFQQLDQANLLKKTRRDLKKFPPLFKDFCDHIVYVKNKKPRVIVDEIVENLKKGESMRPKLLFTDADGTLWNFHDLKAHAPAKKRTLRKATLDPATLPLLQLLKHRKIPVVIISYQSFTSRVYARRKLLTWLKHFHISQYITEIHIAHKTRNPKSRVIQRILKEHCLSPQHALFIGDRYRWDYLEAQKAGVPVVLLKRPENKRYHVPQKTVKEVLERIR